MDNPQAALHAALAQAVASIVYVPKDGFNRHFGYAYTTAEAMIEAGRAALSAHGLALLPTSAAIRGAAVDEHYADPYAKKDRRREPCSPRLVATWLLTHADGGSIPIGPCEWPICVERGRDEQKAKSAAHTNLLSYTIRDLLQIPRALPGDNQDEEPRHDEPPRQAPSLAAALLAATVTADSAERQSVYQQFAGLPAAQRNQLGAYLKALKMWADGTYPLATGSGLTDREIEHASTAAQTVRDNGAAVPWDSYDAAAAPTGDENGAADTAQGQTVKARLEALLKADSVAHIVSLSADAATRWPRSDAATVSAYAHVRKNILAGRDAEAGLTKAQQREYARALDLMAAADG